MESVDSGNVDSDASGSDGFSDGPGVADGAPECVPVVNVITETVTEKETVTEPVTIVETVTVVSLSISFDSARHHAVCC